eukprot:5098371-Prymnesium_polylepis.3
MAAHCRLSGATRSLAHDKVPLRTFSDLQFRFASAGGLANADCAADAGEHAGILAEVAGARRARNPGGAEARFPSPRRALR